MGDVLDHHAHSEWAPIAEAHRVVAQLEVRDPAVALLGDATSVDRHTVVKHGPVGLLHALPLVGADSCDMPADEILGTRADHRGGPLVDAPNAKVRVHEAESHRRRGDQRLEQRLLRALLLVQRIDCRPLVGVLPSQPAARHHGQERADAQDHESGHLEERVKRAGPPATIQPEIDRDQAPSRDEHHEHGHGAPHDAGCDGGLILCVSAETLRNLKPVTHERILEAEHSHSFRAACGLAIPSGLRSATALVCVDGRLRRSRP